MNDLAGITVVTVEQAVAAPYASGRLADAGARVIKIERPEGDFARHYDSVVHGNSAYFVWLNRGKESISLDLKRKQDLVLLRAMLSSADVYIQNLAPGALERIGITISTLREAYPRLICCSISGFGSAGPWKDQKAYDLLIQAESGLSAINGTPEGPARVGVSVCDIAAGMTAYQAILRGLYARERTAQGRAIEVSLFHAMADWMNVPYLQHRYGGLTPQRAGLKHPTIAPYGAFTCKDGKVVLISIQNEREWQRLCSDFLGDASIAKRLEFTSNSSRVAHRDLLDGIVARRFAQFDREQAIERLACADIAYGRLSDLDDLVAHPQNRFVRVDTENGPVELLAPGDIIVGRTQSSAAVPALNQHGDALRAEFANQSARS